MKKATLVIEGMHCASCASNIEKSMGKVKGVSNIRVNVLMKKGYADCADTVTESDVKQAVKRAGYTAIQVTFEQA
ncbi:MAG: heavy metal-associated domain-containing protein [Nanoarchaeota archaeon]